MLTRVLAVGAALLAAATLGGAAAVGIWEAVEDEAQIAAAPVPLRPASAGSGSIADLYKRTSPGVVQITARDGVEVPGRFAPRGGAPTGSGFVIDREGRVVTNQHVVGEADRVEVRFDAGDEVSARVVGTDPSTDVALLQLEDVPDDLQPVELGSSASLEIGDPVIAIGSPFGLQGTVTSGIVSALGRELRAPDGFTIDGAVQTDAALNQGNSGGPLIDGAGRVVGMNSQIASESGGNDGVGYAVPIETVRSVVRELQEDGRVEHSYLGVTLADAESGGARIGQVRPGTAADEGGLRPGDIVVEAAGERVATGEDLRRAVSEREPGDELELRVRRGGQTTTVTVELGTRPQSVS